MTYGNSGGSEYGTISNGSNSPFSILQSSYKINNLQIGSRDNGIKTRVYIKFKNLIRFKSNRFEKFNCFKNSYHNNLIKYMLEIHIIETENISIVNYIDSQLSTKSDFESTRSINNDSHSLSCYQLILFSTYQFVYDFILQFNVIKYEHRINENIIYLKYMSIDGRRCCSHHGSRFKINLNYINY
ncbi:hypothetical protein AGLY_014636, partial [Aphis glycines]